jgi:hypothetical protein
MAQLPHVLDYHLDTMCVSFREMATRQITRQFMVDLEPTALDEIARLATSAKTVRLELNQGRKREGIITRYEVDIAVTNARHTK